MDVLKQYKNKYFSILGDSISTFEGYSDPINAEYYNREYKMQSGILTVLDTWWGQVIEHLEGKLLSNNSISGSTVCWHPAYEVPSYGCSEQRTSSLDKGGVAPDVIMVFMGTNDWGAGLQVKGLAEGKTDAHNLGVFSNAYKAMLEGLKGNYPNSEIWCLTLPISRCTRMPSFTFPYCYGGRHISEYCDAVATCAKECGCRVIDLYHSGEAYDTLDGFHPNVSGMKTLADSIIKELKK